MALTTKQKAGSALALAGASLLAFVAGWEGDERVAYADKLAYNVPTVCNGHTGPEVRVGDVWTKEQCDAILVKNVTKHGEGLLKCVKVPLNQNQYDALNSWTFNVGVGAACGSTLVKLLNMGKYTEACRELDKWVYAGGKKIKGLANRRSAERELCLRPVRPADKAAA